MKTGNLSLYYWSLLLVLLVCFSFGIFTRHKQSKTFPNALLVFLTVVGGWMVYLTLVSRTALLRDFSLPPKLPLLVILPAFLGILVFFKSARSEPYLDAVPVSLPVFFQSFRLFVELLLWRSAVVGMVPKQVSFEGYNYEILVALSALLIGFLLHKEKLSLRALKWWNIWGLLMLLVVVSLFVTTTYFPGVWGHNKALLHPQFTTMPFLLVAGFFMPAAVFVHVFSLLQIRRKRAQAS